MSQELLAIDGWQVEKRQKMMTRRYEFACYSDTRDFLDRLADLSEKTGYYPDLNFGKTHVSVSISANADQLEPQEYDFSGNVNTLALGQAA